MTAYVTRAEVLATFDVAPTAAAKLARIDSLITSVSGELDAEVGFTFERAPAAATETFVVAGRGGSLLHLHGDVKPLAIVPTTVSFAAVWGGTPALVAAGDYVLEQMDPGSGQYDHIRLVGTTSGYSEFPDGYGLVSIVGARGFDTVPANVKEAVIARVRQLYHADPSLVGGVAGPDEGGNFQMQQRWPDEFFKVVRHYQRRYATCYVR